MCRELGYTKVAASTIASKQYTKRAYQIAPVAKKRSVYKLSGRTQHARWKKQDGSTRAFSVGCIARVKILRHNVGEVNAGIHCNIALRAGPTVAEGRPSR